MKILKYFKQSGPSGTKVQIQNKSAEVGLRFAHLQVRVYLIIWLAL